MSADSSPTAGPRNPAPAGSGSGNRGGALGRATIALIAITLVVKVLGFAEKQVIAFYFGTGSQVDAFFVAISVPIAIYLLIRELIEPAFLPLFVAHLDAGRLSRGWKLFFLVGLGILAVTIPVALLGWLKTDALVSWLAPGFDPGTRKLTAGLIRVMIAGGVFWGLSSLTYITLNGYRRFALPASGDLVAKAAPILCVILWVSQLGIFALAIGVLVGCVGRLAIHALGLAHERRLLAWPTLESKEDIRAFSLLIAPLLLGVAFSQVSEFADNYFSSQVGSGAIAARTFARKIVELPIILVPYALSVVAFPYFASLAHRQKWDHLFDFLGQMLRALALVFTFLAVVTILLAEPLITLLFERGAFDAQAREMTAWPLRLYAAGLVTFAIEALLVPFFFAMRDTRTPVLVGIAGVVINIAITAVLIGPLGVGGVAVALTLSKTFKVLLLGALLQRKRPQLRFAPIAASALRIAIAGGMAAIGIYAFCALREFTPSAASLLDQIAHLALASTIGAAAFLAVLMSMDSPERSLTVQGWKALCNLLRGRLGAGS